MKTRPILLMRLVATVVGTTTLSHAQTLIYACVNRSNGAIRIIAPGTTCGTRETLLIWPAEPTTPTTFYQRESVTQPVIEGFATAIALCDDPGVVATGGGFRSDGVPVTDAAYTVVTSTSCAASGLCGGATGQDGWVVVAKSTNVAAQGTRITSYVICTQP
jgi:hypothetical protein